MIGPYEFFAIVLCFVASAFFSASEAVLLSCGVDRIRQFIEEGGKRAQVMKFMAEKPNEILTTILVGNNIANILAASLSTNIAIRIFKQESAVGISALVTTILILIFGEIVPKTVARAHSEKLVFPVTRILQLFYYSMYPVVQGMSSVIKRALGNNAQIRGRIITKDDIEYMVNRAEEEKSIDSKQIDLLNSILEFPTIKVKDIMIPRVKVKWLPTDCPFYDILKFVKEDNHSRYPVCDYSLDHAVGFLHVKELSLIRSEEEIRAFDIKNFVRAPFFVYEHMKIQAVFDHMNRKKVHLALVKDESGLVVGIVTLEDIIEEIMGDILDEHDEDIEELQDRYQIEDLANGIKVDGAISIRDLDSDFDIKIPPSDNYSTLAGFLLELLGNRFPEKEQLIVWEGYSFELSKVENQTIHEITIKEVGIPEHASIE